jgi:exopolysaccharide biosynthesis polyprenyl glycosylphosphotransferase
MVRAGKPCGRTGVNPAVFDEVEGAAATDSTGGVHARRSATRRAARLRLGLVAADAVTSVLVFSLLQTAENGTVASKRGMLGVGMATLVSLLLLGAARAYDPATRLPGARLRMSARLALLACVATLVASLASSGFGGRIDGGYLALVGTLSAAWITARVVASLVERHRPVRTLVIGTGRTARDVWQLCERHRECAIKVVGFVDDEPLSLPPDAPATLGGLADMARIVHEHEIERVIVAYARLADAELLTMIRLVDEGVRVQVVPRLFDLVQARGFELGRMSILEAGGVSPGAMERFVKRGFDLAMAVVLLILLAPVLTAIAVAIKLDDHGPVLFRQRRVGMGGGSFTVYKFRTLETDAEQRGFELISGLGIGDAVRELKRQSGALHSTRIGRRLRPVGLDELPQLWNVLRGDMSLVGPRPLREYEVAALDDFQSTSRQAVRPGITGLWQVSGRDATSWEERVQLDCIYARHWSMTSDLRILARTMGAVLQGRRTS